MIKKLMGTIAISVLLILTSCATNSNIDNNSTNTTSPKTSGIIYPIRKDGKYGYINSQGKMVIHPQYEIANNYKEDRALVMLNGKYGFINKKGEYIIQPKFSYLAEFSEGLALFGTKDNKYGYINPEGKIVIDAKFNNASSFSDGAAVVQNTAKNGYIDTKGNFILQPKYLYASSFSNGLACVVFTFLPETTGYINKQGETIIQLEKFPKDPITFAGTTFIEGLAFKRSKDGQGSLKWVLIDTKGNRVGDLYFDEVRDFNEGYASVKVGNKWGAIGKKGSFEISPQFDYLGELSEGLIPFQSNAKQGYVDKTGKVVIQPKYDFAMPFYEGLASVDVGSVIGYIDKTGEFVYSTNT